MYVCGKCPDKPTFDTLDEYMDHREEHTMAMYSSYMDRLIGLMTPSLSIQLAQACLQSGKSVDEAICTYRQVLSALMKTGLFPERGS